MSASIRSVAPTGLTIYAHVMNSTNQRWNGTAFETYSSANWLLYGIALTEQGTSGIYVATFPATIPAGSYEMFSYSQAGGAQDESDSIVSTSNLEWDGFAATVPATPAGALTSTEMYNYILRAFKRTDKATEVFEALTDTIREIRRRLEISDDEESQILTDTIGTLGEYQLDLESDTGLIIGDPVVVDGTDSWPLTRYSKARFDEKYPNPAATNVSKGKPVDYCIYKNQIILGPVPDSTSYTYRMNFTSEGWENYINGSTAVPFSGKYREALKYGTLARLYIDLELSDRATVYDGLFERQMNQIEFREGKNRDASGYTEVNDVC